MHSDRADPTNSHFKKMACSYLAEDNPKGKDVHSFIISLTYKKSKLGGREEEEKTLRGRPF